MTQTTSTAMVVTATASKMTSPGSRAGSREVSPYGSTPSHVQHAPQHAPSRRILPKTPDTGRLSHTVSVNTSYTEPGASRMAPVGRDSPKGPRSAPMSPGATRSSMSETPGQRSSTKHVGVAPQHRTSAFISSEPKIDYKSASTVKIPHRTHRVVSPGAEKITQTNDNVPPQGAKKIMTGTMEAISNMILSRSGYTTKASSSDVNTQIPKPRQSVVQAQSPSPRTSSRTSPSPAKQNSPSSNAMTQTSYSSTKQLTPLSSNKAPECTGSSGVDAKKEPVPQNPAEVKPLTKNNVLTSEAEKSKMAPLTKSNVITSQVDSIMLMSLAGSTIRSPAGSMLCLSNAKEYIMDKYFEEMAKSWNTPDNASTGRWMESHVLHCSSL